MPYVVARGNTLLIPSGTPKDPDKMHLFVVCTDKCDDGLHLLVSASTIRPKIFHDQTCILKAGCHEFITADSYIEYRLAATMPATRIVKCADGGVYVPKAPVSAAILESICNGFSTSRFVSAKIHKYFIINQP